MAASKCLYRLPVMSRYQGQPDGQARLKPKSKKTVESPPGSDVLEQLERIYGGNKERVFFPGAQPGQGKPVRVAYQGMRGSYCHEAAVRAFERCDAVPYGGGMDSAFAALDSTAADVAVVPVENSLDGVIDRNYDLILRHQDVHVVGELLLPINHCLLGLHDGVRRVVSHPQALAHCEGRLAELAVDVEPVDNAATAARHVAENGAGDTAVIGSLVAAREFGLRVIEENMQDDSSNTTRFLVLGKKGEENISLGVGEEYSKTTVAFSLREGTAGLFKALAIFCPMRMSHFQSRPARDNPIRVVEREEGVSLNYFEYVFFVDVEVPATDPAMERAVAELKEISTFVRVVGSYAMAS